MTDVWWAITNPATGQTMYTLASDWAEAQATFGGDCSPRRVPPDELARIEEMLRANGAISWSKK